ncbi:MAG: carbohydrate kinase family protein [Nitrosomonas sp.]|uniref:carbohydrate kinase family protein n=1 Tax=Nitrosomonas sp. TaxID=42353 RepID=UPI0027357597|nr:carbohydrate kinase family protein [Nitrosomonas sp.]MDP3279606.1 carbohydrate kinase family protein [Nitrosomonas sp.]MDP3662724.1 carbohydrate kinase family protein [Nitrosomonas sp.]MDZ4106332.1 carbohydrate kinase family protein [Nitrosomonas sp.]
MTGLMVFGDLNVDIVTENLSLGFRGFEEGDGLVFSNLKISVGGSAFNFADHAHAQYRDSYGPVTICGAIGRDAIADIVVTRINESGIMSELQRVNNADSGCAIILWDAAGHRMIINNAPNANLEWNPDADTFLPIIDGRIVYVSGYCLIGSNPRSCWWEKWFDDVKHRCSFLIIDVVPHRIHNLVQPERLLKYLGGADLIVSEVSTLRRVIGVGNPDEVVTEILARETKDILLARFGGAFILRYGKSGCDEQMVCKASGEFEVKSTDYASESEKVGYGDALLVRVLSEFL